MSTTKEAAIQALDALRNDPKLTLEATLNAFEVIHNHVSDVMVELEEAIEEEEAENEEDSDEDEGSLADSTDDNSDDDN